MGVVLNPVAYRVGYKYSWKDAWYTHRLTYSAFIHDVLAFKALMFFVFFRYFSYKRAFWLYSHANVYIFNNKIFVNLYLYDANEVQMYYDVARRYKKVGWYRLNAVSGWFKNHFFDRKSRLKRFHYFTRTIRFIYDLMVYEDFRYVLRKDRRTVFKLKDLHYKKTIKPATKNIRAFKNKENQIKFLKQERSMKAIWLPWEEIKPFRLPFKSMVFHMNHFSVKWWSSRFRLFYNASIKKILKNEKIYMKKRLKKVSKIKKFKFKKKSKMKKKRYFRKFAKRLINKKLRKKRELAEIKSFRDERRFSKKFLNKRNLYFRVVRSNNRLLFTFLAFFNKLFKNMTFMYDLKIFRRKWVRKILRFYVYFFLRKAIIKLYGKIAEYFASYLNINFNIKLYILNNNSVGAVFISRFIAIGLRNKFDYLDMMIPIRKSLRKQMYARKWSKSNLNTYKSDFLLKKKKLIIAVTPLKDIFFFRMQLLNNYIKFRSFYNIFNNNKLKNKKFNNMFNKRKISGKKFNNKLKFHYYNFKLLNNLQLFNKYSLLNNFKRNNKLHFKNNMINIGGFIKMLNNLSIFNFKSISTYHLKIIKYFLLSKNVSFIFYKSIWYRVLFFNLFWKFLNKKMFFYYLSLFSLNENNVIKQGGSVNFLKLIHFNLFFKTTNKLKPKRFLRYNNYIVLKKRQKLNFCLKYYYIYIKNLRIRKLKRARLIRKFSLSYKKFKKLALYKKLKLRLQNKNFKKYKIFKIKKKNLKFKTFKLKKKIKKKILKFNFRFKYKKKWKDLKHKKRKLKFKIYKNKKFRKNYNLRKKKRFSYLKKIYIKNIISLKYNIFNKINGFYFYKNYLFNTNKYNNFILNSFYNKKVSRFFLFSYNYKKKYKNLFKYFKLIKRFKKFLYSIYNLRKHFLNYKKFHQLHRKIKNSYELFLINKSILFDRIVDGKLPLKANNTIIIHQGKLVNFSFINLLIVYKLFRKRLKNLNININYYNKRFKYFVNKKGLKNKKYEITFLHLFLIIRYYYKIFSMIKYFIGFKYKINNYNFLLNHNMRKYKFNKFLNNYEFEKITSMITHDKIKNILFYSFTDIHNFNYKFNVNVIGLKNRFFYYKNYKIREKDVFFGEKYKYPLFFYNKTRRMKFFDDYQTMLYGYKFHFVGRFTRKQQAANLWYKLGSLANASAVANVDYAFYTVILRYSVCTVKVWLYRSRKAMKYKYRVF